MKTTKAKKVKSVESYVIKENASVDVVELATNELGKQKLYVIDSFITTKPMCINKSFLASKVPSKNTPDSYISFKHMTYGVIRVNSNMVKKSQLTAIEYVKKNGVEIS